MNTQNERKRLFDELVDADTGTIDLKVVCCSQMTPLVIPSSVRDTVIPTLNRKKVCNWDTRKGQYSDKNRYLNTSSCSDNASNSSCKNTIDNSNEGESVSDESSDDYVELSSDSDFELEETIRSFRMQLEKESLEKNKNADEIDSNEKTLDNSNEVEHSSEVSIDDEIEEVRYGKEIIEISSDSDREVNSISPSPDQKRMSNVVAWLMNCNPGEINSDDKISECTNEETIDVCTETVAMPSHSHSDGNSQSNSYDKIIKYTNEEEIDICAETVEISSDSDSDENRESNSNDEISKFTNEEEIDFRTEIVEISSDSNSDEDSESPRAKRMGVANLNTWERNSDLDDEHFRDKTVENPDGKECSSDCSSDIVDSRMEFDIVDVNVTLSKRLIKTTNESKKDGRRETPNCSISEGKSQTLHGSNSEERREILSDSNSEERREILSDSNIEERKEILNESKRDERREIPNDSKSEERRMTLSDSNIEVRRRTPNNSSSEERRERANDSKGDERRENLKNSNNFGRKVQQRRAVAKIIYINKSMCNVRLKSIGPACSDGCFDIVTLKIIEEILVSYWKLGMMDQLLYLSRLVTPVLPNKRMYKRRQEFNYKLRHEDKEWVVCETAFLNAHAIRTDVVVCAWRLFSTETKNRGKRAKAAKAGEMMKRERLARAGKDVEVKKRERLAQAVNDTDVKKLKKLSQAVKDTEMKKREIFVQTVKDTEVKKQEKQALAVSHTQVKKQEKQDLAVSHTQVKKQEKQDLAVSHIEVKKQEKLDLAVTDHLKSLPLVASRNSQVNGMPQRVYLAPDLDLETLYALYVDYVMQKDPLAKTVTEALYRRIFENESVVGLAPTKTAQCCVCEMLNRDVDKFFTLPDRGASLEEAKAKLRKHQIFGEEDQEIMRSIDKRCNKENALIIYVDVRQCQPIPKMPMELSYYKRKLWTYNLGIWDLRKQDAMTVYVWDEVTAKRGSIEVIACLSKWIDVNHDEEDYLILFTDSIGRYRNMNVLLFFLRLIHLKKFVRIDHYLLVPGHYDDPCSRIFGDIESVLKNQKTITTKDDLLMYIRLGVSSSEDVAVVEMERKDFLNYSVLKSYIQEREIDTMSYRKARWVSLDWHCMEGYHMNMDYGLKSVSYQVRLMPGHKPFSHKTFDLGEVEIPLKYPSPIPLDPQKLGDLKDLLHSIIPFEKRNYLWRIFVDQESLEDAEIAEDPISEEEEDDLLDYV